MGNMNYTTLMSKAGDADITTLSRRKLSQKDKREENSFWGLIGCEARCRRVGAGASQKLPKNNKFTKTSKKTTKTSILQAPIELAILRSSFLDSIQAQS